MSTPALLIRRGRNVTELNATYPISGPLSDEPAKLRACALRLI